MSGGPKDPREQAFNAGVGSRVNAHRKMAGMTQVELAETALLGRGSIAMIETGRQGASPFQLAALAKALHVEVDELVPRIEPLPPLVKVEIRTRHPESYELLNHEDGTRWVIVDGKWQAKP